MSIQQAVLFIALLMILTALTKDKCATITLYILDKFFFLVITPTGMHNFYFHVYCIRYGIMIVIIFNVVSSSLSSFHIEKFDNLSHFVVSHSSRHI
mmetsp:Transcript_29494/g.43500  ORF Transcript_29494/g.43500 Transcript_29494/m.43500 type:complete len:96 (+) Transcript_29494:12-299(+)